MRVLVVGATGSLGSRLVPTLLARGHTVIAFVRSPEKLTTILPPPLMKRIEIATGDAEDVQALKTALKEHRCDGIVCVAGAPSSPFGGPPSRQGHIGKAVATAAKEVGETRGKPLRGWWLAGIIFMEMPGQNGRMFHEFWPSFRPEHILTVRTLQSIPTSSLEWSVFCPARMKISNPVVISNPSTSLGDHLVLGSDTPPMYQPTGWLQYIPFIGMMLEIIVMAIRYTTVMEDVADKIAGEFGEERWVGKLVGAREMKRKMESSQEIRRESESS